MIYDFFGVLTFRNEERKPRKQHSCWESIQGCTKKKHFAPRSQLNGNGQLIFQTKPYPRNGGSLTCLNPTPCLSIVVVNLDDLGYFNFGKPPSESLYIICEGPVQPQKGQGEAKLNEYYNNYWSSCVKPHQHMELSINGGYPKSWMVYFMENPIKILMTGGTRMTSWTPPFIALFTIFPYKPSNSWDAPMRSWKPRCSHY